MSSSHQMKINLTSEQRVQFWNIFVTALVGLFSFWLGIAIQDDISTKNARETQKLARYQMVEAVYPKYTQFIDTGGYVFYDLMEMATLDEKEAKAALKEYLKREKVPFIETMKNSVNFMSDNRYYFSNSTQKRICGNDIAMQIGLRLMEPGSALLESLIKGAPTAVIDHELSSPYYIKDMVSYRDETVKEIKSRINDFCNDSDTSYATIAYYFLFMPYVDNFNVYSQELIPNDDVGSHLWRHILMLAVCVILGLVIGVGIYRYIFSQKFNQK